jgi:hypothetical protein
MSTRFANAKLFAAGLALALATAAIAEDKVADDKVADDKAARVERRAEFLKQMRAIAEASEVTFADTKRPAQLITSPVFRYDDQPRRFLDATMWIWTDGVRPVACQKVEARRHTETDKPEWGYCFTSLAEQNIAARWSTGKNWNSREAGIAFQPVPGASAPAATSAARKRQLRDLAREFSARLLIDPRIESTAEMRVLPTPIFEYADPKTKLQLGAVFGFEANGTNPDLLMLIEARGDDKPAWHFAPARMTNGGVTLKIRDQTVWECPFVDVGEGPFANWLFFYSSREPVAGE